MAGKHLHIAERRTSGTLPTSQTHYLDLGSYSDGSALNSEGRETNPTGFHPTHTERVIRDDKRYILYLYHRYIQGHWLNGKLASKTTYRINANDGTFTEMEREEYQWDKIKLSDQRRYRALRFIWQARNSYTYETGPFLLRVGVPQR